MTQLDSKYIIYMIGFGTLEWRVETTWSGQPMPAGAQVLVAGDGLHPDYIVLKTEPSSPIYQDLLGAVAAARRTLMMARIALSQQ
jgi:hypothetical protein